MKQWWLCQGKVFDKPLVTSMTDEICVVEYSECLKLKEALLEIAEAPCPIDHAATLEWIDQAKAMAKKVLEHIP